METTRIKLLAIDDLRDNLTTLKAVVQDALPSCTLLTALNGIDGLRLARAEDPDVILLDIVMPDMDGFEVCRRLKADENLRLIPVIFLTALRTDRESRVHALEVGAEAFLSKPIDELELVAEVRAMAKIKAANRLQRMEKERLADMVAERTRELNAELKERRRSEEALRLTTQMLDIAPCYITVHDFKGKMLYANRQACLMHGYTEQEFATINLEELNTPEAAAFIQQRMSLIAKKGEAAFESVHRRKDGSTFPLDVHAKVVSWEGIPAILGAGTDISERKQLQKTLEQRILALTRPLDESSDITFEQLFDIKEIQRIQDEFAAATGVTSSIFRPDGTEITEVSYTARLCRHIIRKTEKGLSNCFSSDEKLGLCSDPDKPFTHRCLSAGLWDGCVKVMVGDRHLANWMLGQVRDETHTEEQALQYAREIGADEQLFLKEFRALPRMSEHHFKEIAQALFTLVKQLSTSAYQNIQQARFIAERQKAEEDLVRLSAAINQTVESVVVTDAKGTIQYVNPAFEQITGYSRHEAVGQNPRVLKSGKHDESFYRDLWQTISSGRTWAGQFINKRKDGSLYTEEATISPVCDPNGAIKNYVAVKRDITDELSKEEEFRQAQKMEAVGQLAGGIAHDFNNILQAILGFSEILLNKLNPDTAEHRNVSEIRKAAARAAELTRQMLAFSRKKPAEKNLININSVVQDSEILLHLLLGNDITSLFDLSQDLPLITADSGQITQIIMNLAINARDAMPDGGRLTICTEKTTLAPPDATTGPDSGPGNFICLSVTDTGQGMSQEVKDHLFEPFFTTKAPGKGTGLGLSVIYGIVKQHKGWIEVYSEEGLGTTFKIFLPVNTSADLNTALPAGHAQSSKYPKHILLTEDDLAVRNMVIRLLQSSGYEVTTAGNAGEAIELFTRNPNRFDLLFSDIVLPGIGGIELADRLREIKPALPVLLYSGYRDQREQWNALGTKGYKFLQKPFTATALLAAVFDTLAEKTTGAKKT